MNAALHGIIEIESDTLEKLRQAVYDVADRVAGILALNAQTKQIAVDAIRAAAIQMKGEIEQIVVDAKRLAGDLAVDRVIIEARLVGIELEPFAPEVDDFELRAEAVASSYSAAWMFAALALLIGKGSHDLRQALRATDGRLRAIVDTEITNAYSTVAGAAFDELAMEPGLVKRWNAFRDLRTCRICRDHDGEEVPVGEPFSRGDAPGRVHPRCRCILSLERAAAKKAA